MSTIILVFILHFLVTVFCIMNIYCLTGTSSIRSFRMNIKHFKYINIEDKVIDGGTCINLLLVGSLLPILNVIIVLATLCVILIKKD